MGRPRKTAVALAAVPEEHPHETPDGATHKHTHSHTHSAEEYKKLIHRISIIIGHMTSVKKMLEDERDCTEILVQISAVQSSLNNLGKLILKNHIDECLFTVSNGEDYSSKQDILNSLNGAIDKFVR